MFNFKPWLEAAAHHFCVLWEERKQQEVAHSEPVAPPPGLCSVQLDPLSATAARHLITWSETNRDFTSSITDHSRRRTLLSGSGSAGSSLGMKRSTLLSEPCRLWPRPSNRWGLLRAGHKSVLVRMIELYKGFHIQPPACLPTEGRLQERGFLLGGRCCSFIFFILQCSYLHAGVLALAAVQDLRLTHKASSWENLKFSSQAKLQQKPKFLPVGKTPACKRNESNFKLLNPICWK